MSPDPKCDRALLEQVLAERSLRTFFQPLCNIRKQAISGVEALSRGINPDTGEVIPPADLFKCARRNGLAVELDRLCHETTLRTFAELRREHTDMTLFMNYDTGTVDEVAQAHQGFMGLVNDSGVVRDRIVVEVLESATNSLSRLQTFTDKCRERGFLIALDDVGSGHSNLERVPRLKPDIIKICGSIIQNFLEDHHAQVVFETLVRLAHQTGALIVAEGVETREQAVHAIECGADLLQGYYLARPAPAANNPIETAREAIRPLADCFETHAMQVAKSKREEAARQGQIIREIIAALVSRAVNEYEAALAEQASTHPEVECLYILDTRGMQLTPTIFREEKAEPRGHPLFEPAERGADHSLKEYVMFLKSGLPRYLTDPYISSATGNLCKTLAITFRHETYGEYILCTDFQVSSNKPVEQR